MSGFKFETGIQTLARQKYYAEYRTVDATIMLNEVSDGTLSKYGGLIGEKHEATGFFYIKKIGDRWVMIDPEGNVFYNSGVASVRPKDRPENEYFSKKYNNDPFKWAKDTAKLFSENNINSIGGFSDCEYFGKVLSGVRIPYTKSLRFMVTYSADKNILKRGYGHSHFKADILPVFDEKFKTFADNYAKEQVIYDEDPYLIGYFTDNELPLFKIKLDAYLSVEDDDIELLESKHVAESWMKQKKGADFSIDDITDDDRDEFRGYVYDTYCKIVTSAIKKYDDKHLILGSRFYANDKVSKILFTVAGKYFDVVSVNYYGDYIPNAQWMENWGTWANKPFMITEWYAMSEDSGYTNGQGAGFIVKTEAERALFYETFTLNLLKSKSCVGWHWFRYMDEPSYSGSNKGILKLDYTPYQTLLKSVSKINKSKYGLMTLFDSNLI